MGKLGFLGGVIGQPWLGHPDTVGWGSCNYAPPKRTVPWGHILPMHACSPSRTLAIS